MAQWAAEKFAARPQREGETSAENDANEAVHCFRREKADGPAQAALLLPLKAQTRARGPSTS